MVQLKQITRNATFAWSPAQGKPLIASGTIAGAVDASFSQDSELEIWDLDLDNTDTAAFELAPAAKISTERKFYSLAWGYVTPERPKGVIAGAMDDGQLNIWDVNAILANTPQTALVTSNATHRGSIKVVEFNPVTPKILMSAGQGGEFNIWDLENPTVPFPAPNRASRVEDIEAASWNRTVANILATGSGNGFTSVWDLKQGREILHLRNPNRERVSSLAWDPDNPTRIITGCDDSSAVLYVWDLRNSHAPAQTLEGHSAGVLAVNWCDRDRDLLLSCGKDNRTLLWNPQTPKLLGEFPIASTWAFEARWCPQNPNILANATFEGKISVHRLQSAVPKQEVNGAQTGAGEDFFSQRQYVSEGGFELKQPPKWFQVPVSSSFGFGGSLVEVKNEKGKGSVRIGKFISEPKISENATEFEEAIQSADWTGFCDKQIEKAGTDAEKGNWKLLKLLFDADLKQSLIEYLGVKQEEVALLNKQVEGLKLEKTDSEATVADSLNTETTADATPKNNRLSGIFGGESDFLSQLSSSSEPQSLNTPFSILSSHDSASDKSITEAILFGQFEKAVDLCLKEDRLSDAFILATLGDKALQKKVQDAYFTRKDHRASYLRVLQSVVEGNLWDVAENTDLAGWKQTLVFFCTYAKTDQDFSGVCDALGKRLEKEKRVEDAKVCYLAGKNLDRVVNIWIAEADAQEKAALAKAESDSAFSIHARALQGFVEKVTVFKQTKGTSTTVESKALYNKYTEFVEIVASQGNLSVAEKYIDLLPADNETVKSVKSRLVKAMSKSAVVVGVATVAGAAAVKTPGRSQPAGRLGQPPIPTGPTPYTPAGSFQPTPYTPAFPPPATHTAPAPMTGPPMGGLAKPSPYGPPPTTLNPYGPPTTASPYAPATPLAGGPGTTYTPPITGAPTSSQQGAFRSHYAPAGPINAYTPGLTPSNAAFSRIADLPPPPKKTGENWNDPPMMTNPIRTRTPVPGIQPPSPFTGASGSSSPNLSKAPPAPPPASAKPPQRVKSPPMSSPQMGGAAFAAPPRAGSAQPFGPSQAQRGPAPTSFTPPPPRTSQAPPPPPGQGYRGPSSSRPQHAAIPGMQVQSQNNVPTPPPQTSSSHYASPPGSVRSPYAPAPTISPPETPAAPPTAPAKQAPPQPKYPLGDRSHIPASSKPIYDIFCSEMNHIKAVAQVPQQKRIIIDVDKRLNILFDLLNDESIHADIISKLVKLAHALSQRQFDVASQLQLELHTQHEQYSAWMLGIKRLVDMSRVFSAQQ